MLKKTPIKKKVSSKKEKRVVSQKEQFKKYLERVEDPNYQGLVSQSLPENPSPTEKAKYEICQNFIRYKRRKSLSTDELAQQINLTNGEIQEILFCYINNFTLDRLVFYAGQIFKPLTIKIQTKEQFKGIAR